MSATDGGARLAVIAVSHNSGHVLPHLVDSLEAVADRSLLEICVVDSGSSEEQIALIEHEVGARVDRLVSLPNVGYGAACNAGVAATTAPVLLFANPDVALRSLPTRALDGRGLDGALLSGFALSPHRPLGFADLPSLRSQAEELTIARWSRAFGRTASGPAWVSGAALMIERADFDRIGGFSSAFFMYFEDADLCLRHRYAGGHVELDEGLVIEHGGGKSTRKEDRSAATIALDGINRLSGRNFVARYGRPGDRALLYLVMLIAYAPRRALVHLFRDRWGLRDTLEHLACLLRPERALRKLNAAVSR
jgi:N-acetylglucosaminyl-diphospho-decaprenol L-rhamnosyltransferase